MAKVLLIIAVTIFGGAAASASQVDVEITNVPTAPELTLELTLTTGVNLADSASRNVIPKTDRIRAGRSSGRIRHSFKNVTFPEGAEDFVLFGSLIDVNNNTVRYVPVRVFKLSSQANKDKIRVSVDTIKEAGKVFSESFPFRHSSLENFISPENVRTVLFSIKTLLDNGAVSSQPEWARIQNFFDKNTDFFAKYESRHITDILNFLKSETANTGDENYLAFYVRFLTSLIELDIDGRPVFDDQQLGEFVFNELKRMCRANYRATFSICDDAQRAYLAVDDISKCLEFSEEILRGANQYVMKTRNLPESVRAQLVGAMLNTTVCAQKHFVDETEDTNLNMVEEGSRQLVIGYAGVAGAFVDLFETAEDKGLVKQRYEHVSEITKFYPKYKTALLARRIN